MLTFLRKIRRSLIESLSAGASAQEGGFLRDEHQTNTRDISHIQNPLNLMRQNRKIQLELEELAVEATGRVNAAGKIREAAKNLITSINQHIHKM